MRPPKFLDFGPTHKTAVQLLGLVPSIIVSQENANIEEMSGVYKSDFPSPHTFDIDYDLQHFSTGAGSGWWVACKLRFTNLTRHLRSVS